MGMAKVTSLTRTFVCSLLSAVVADSVQMLQNMKNGQCLHPNSIANDVPETIACNSADSSQIFENSPVNLEIAIGGQCMSALNDQYGEGLRFVLGDCTSNNNQIWNLNAVAVTSITYSLQLIHVSSGMCLAALGPCGMYIAQQVCSSYPSAIPPEQVWIMNKE